MTGFISDILQTRESRKRRTGLETTGIVTAKMPLLIVADDLTGACDAGIHFAVRGVPTQVAIAPEGYSVCDAAVIICNTHTRCSAVSEISERLEPVLKLACERKLGLLMKKVDSTLRGPVEREIEWMLEWFSLRLALLAPAFPGAGRKVRDGRVVLSEGDAEIDIAACFPNLKPACAARGEINTLPQRIADEIKRGTRLLIVDAEDNEDLQRIAQVGQATDGVLFAGSGGLAQALATEFEQREPLEPMKAADDPVLICVGSDHPVTATQLQYLQQQITLLKVQADEAGLYAARAALQGGIHVALEFSREQLDGHPDVELAGKAGVRHCGAMILTGGDTAMHVLCSLGAQALELKAEIEPGIPCAKIRGGSANGMTIVTKSGGFGNDSSLLQCVKFLHSLAMHEPKMEVL